MYILLLIIYLFILLRAILTEHIDRIIYPFDQTFQKTQITEKPTSQSICLPT